MLDMRQKQQSPKFELGTVSISAAANARLTDQDVDKALSLHERGDWGMLCPKDWQINDEALRTGGGLLSVDQSAMDEKFYVMADIDRRPTYVMFPQDY
jgi:hypothetical protein